MLSFVQASTTAVADLMIEQDKNAFLKNTPALIWLEPRRLFFASGA
jgi:hypothetical protein